MRALMYIGDRKTEIREVPTPRPGPGQALVKVRASGICGSDLQLYRGDRIADWIPGHEPCGDVAELGPGVNGLKIGQRVVNYHYQGCGSCKYCRSGWEQLCIHGKQTFGFGADGANAEYLLVPARSLLPMPDELSYEVGTAIACGTGTAYTALKRLDVSGRDTLAVFGQGPVGLSALLLAKAMGARVIALDTVPQRLEFARCLGADEIVNAAEVDAVEAIRALTHGEGAETTIDCTGNAKARAQTVAAAKVWGRICYVGEGGSVTLHPSDDMIRRYLTIYASWTFSSMNLEELMQFVIDRRIPLDKLITGRFTFEQADEALSRFEAGAPGKFVFVLPA